MSGEKAKYRVLRLSHIHNNLWPEGSEIEYDGIPGSALEPVNEAAKAAKEKAMAGNSKAKVVAVIPETVIPEAVITAETLETVNEGVDADLDKLREEYEALFNEKPHHNAKAETIREKIADKRKELGL